MTYIDTVKAQLLRQIDSAGDDLGIYPQSTKGYGDERDYEQRDGFKNGWNACVMEFIHKVKDRLGVFDAPWEGPEQLFCAAGDGEFYFSDGKWSVMLNDTWYYASADAEPIDPSEYQTVADWYSRFGSAGVLCWVAEKRGHLPDIKRNARRIETIRELKKIEDEEAAKRRAEIEEWRAKQKETR